MSQRTEILSALQQGESITPLDALDRFGTMRLAARCQELRDEGYDIKTTMRERNGKAYAVYTMEVREQPELF